MTGCGREARDRGGGSDRAGLCTGEEARLCKAMLDRLTDQAHIIETGSDSYRFRRTLDRRRKKNKEGDQEK